MNLFARARARLRSILVFRWDSILVDGNRFQIVEINSLIVEDANDSRFMGRLLPRRERHEGDHPQIMEPNSEDSCVV